MKQYRIFLLAAFFFSTALISVKASTGEGGELRKTIKKEVTYPDFARDQKLQGTVLVAYEIDQKGKILVTEINASDEIFGLYVKRTLESLTVNQVEATGKHFAKFNFKYVEVR